MAHADSRVSPGIENVYGIAVAVDTVVALTIGLEDYTADLGVPRTNRATRRSTRGSGSSTPRAPRSPGDRLGVWRRRRHGGLQGVGDAVESDRFRGDGMHSPPSDTADSRVVRATQFEIEKALRIVRLRRRVRPEGRHIVVRG